MPDSTGTRTIRYVYFVHIQTGEHGPIYEYKFYCLPDSMSHVGTGTIKYVHYVHIQTGEYGPTCEYRYYLQIIQVLDHQLRTLCSHSDR